MKYEDLYENITISLIKFIQDFRDLYPDSVYYDFDGHAQISELPKGLLIGPAGLGMTDEGQEIQVVFGFSVAIDNDPSLFLLRQVISKLGGRLRPQTRIDIYDGDIGTPVGYMVITPPVSTTPITSAELRSVQSVMGSAVIDPSFLTSR